MRKRLALLSLSFLIAPFFLDSCKKIAKNEAYYAAAARYVYAYTSGAIGRNETIRVRFVNPAVGQDKIGQKVPADIFSVSPNIPGQAVWEDDRTIKLEPTQPLDYGKRFTGKVGLKKLFADVPKEVRFFEFEFSVRELALEVVTEGLRAEDPNDLRRQQITGRVLISDPVDNASLEKILRATQGNKNLNINWLHAGDGLSHTFSVVDVERGNVRSKVNLAWSGKPLGLSVEGSEEVTVPALDEFVVLYARVQQTEEQFVLLNFSDPIAAAQALDGLLRIDGFEGALRFAIDGNFVRVYPSGRITGTHNLRVEAGIRNAAGAAMKERSDWSLNFEDLKPAVRLVGRGAIIPQNADGGVIFPFEAVGLNAVDVEVFKIYNSNILQYLQVNELEGEQELERVGKIILQKKISLRELNPNALTHAWQRYAFDLKDIIQQDPGAIYQVRLAFRRGYTDYTCQTSAATKQQNEEESRMAYLGHTNEEGNLTSIMGSYRGIYFNDNDYRWYEEGDESGDDNDDGPYRWSNRDNPCKREYYNYEHFAKRNVFVSDLGLTAKRGKDGSVFAAVTDLHTTEPVGGVSLEFYNYQLQPIVKVNTDGNGTAMIDNLREKPFVVVATRGNRRGYLRMVDGSSLSLSRFDVAGVEAQKGLKGFIYGERGVWRPGDSLYLDFVLEDKPGTLPAGHPVTFELTDPKGALQYRTVTGQSVGGVYALHCATRADALTGDWMAKVQVGGATFTKTLKIETVKPNRLKLALDFGRRQINASDENLNGKLTVNWLHGAVAKNLKAKVEAQVKSTKTEFPNYKDFVFDDPARSFSSEPQVLFDANLDDNGQANIPLSLSTNDAAPGRLIASFKVRAFEAGGDFSTDNFALDYFPYDRYVGVSIPANRWGSKEISLDGGEMQFALVDKDGRPLAGQKVEAGLYRCDWRWWWDEDRTDNVAQFNSATHVNAIDKITLTTDGRGVASWKIKPGQWGRYLVRVSDPVGGHCSGDFFWSGYPDQLNDQRSRNAAGMLPFSVDKGKYAVGEEVTLKVPAGDAGRILLTLESGARVVQHLWFDAKAGDNMLKFKATADMTPTVYAHVSLLQPHAQTQNDLPIRMYGVMPVNVENPSTHLQPQLEMPDVLKPGEAFTVNVRETAGKACAYTLAIVDEGLLDLTRYQTPNPWDAFYAREALGVNTWDVYDYVLGAYGAQLERVLSIGGDGINQKARNSAQINRFKPAVVHVGPFYLEKGKTASHTLKLDNYVGSVRAMLVCAAPAPGSQGAYGSAEKTCPVRKPLMILPTLPRVLGPGETLRLPVDVFAMENKVKSATIRVKENSGLVSVQGSASNTLNFKQPGEEMTYFNLKVGNRTGAAKFTIEAQGGGESTRQDIEILVRNPNPSFTNVWQGVLEPGQEWNAAFDPAKYSDISTAVIEVSALPPVNMSRHLDYLIQYPHGCIEQTTSAAFPQLFAELLTPLTDKQKQTITRNVTAAIEKMRSFQNYDGGFSYWPGGGSADDWASSYAGHFLLEAKTKGYAMPAGLLEKWQEYQTKASRQWNPVISTAQDNWREYDNSLTQAYRLYTLALSGKADIAGMNRLRESKNLFTQSAYLLANAYAQAGKKEVAREIVNAKHRDDWNYTWCGYTYGSNLRDKALMLETYVAIGDKNQAETTANALCQQLGGEPNWAWNTQGLATGLRALSRYAALNAGNLGGPKFSYRLGGSGYQNGDGSRMISTVNFTESALNNGNISVRNNGSGKLYARLIIGGQPLAGEENSGSSNIALDVKYTDTKGNPIDIGSVRQGADFVAEVTVRRQSDMNFDFNELALSQIFPSGWEVLNARMNDIGVSGSSAAEYQDIRDDRVYTYFDIPFVYDYNKNHPINETRVYRIQLNAAYAGRYYLPAVSCEAMYDNRIRANTAGRWVEVI